MAESLHEKFERYLNDFGLRMTDQKADFLSEVISLRSEFTTDEILIRLEKYPRGRRVSRSSVYRYLKLLVDAGLLNERRGWDGMSQYNLKHSDGYRHNRF